MLSINNFSINLEVSRLWINATRYVFWASILGLKNDRPKPSSLRDMTIF